MKSFQRSISLILVLLSLLFLPSPVLAVTIVSSSEERAPFSFDCMSSYVSSVIGPYLQYNKLFESSNDYYLSQGLPIHNDEDPYNHIYFAFQNSTNIGYLTVSYYDGKYYSSFVSTNNSLVTSSIIESHPLLVFSNNHHCYLFCNENLVDLNGTPIFDSTLDSAIHSLAEALTLSPVLYHPVATYGSTIEDYCDVPFVSNAAHPDISGAGLCWAACVSSIGSYKTEVTAMDADDLYTWVKNNITDVSIPGVTYPDGYPQYILKTLARKYGVNYTYTASGLDLYTVMNHILNDSPVYASINYVINEGTNNERTFGHAVVICGAMLSGTAGFYSIMDPNVPESYVTVQIDDASATDFLFLSNGKLYKNWDRTYSE